MSSCRATNGKPLITPDEFLKLVREAKSAAEIQMAYDLLQPNAGAAEMKPIDEILHDFGCELAAHGLIDRHDIIGLQLPKRAFIELLGRCQQKAVRGPGSGTTNELNDLVLVACDSGASINVTKQW